MASIWDVGVSYFQEQQCVNVLVKGDDASGSNDLVSLLQSLLQKVISCCDQYFEQDMTKSVSWITDWSEISNISIDTKCIVFLVFDICDPSSLEFALCNDHRQFLQTLRFYDIYIIGNKIELEYWRHVNVLEGARAAKSAHASYIEVSSLTGQHADYLVDVILRAVFPKLNDNSAIGDIIALLTHPPLPPTDSSVPIPSLGVLSTRDGEAEASHQAHVDEQLRAIAAYVEQIKAISAQIAEEIHEQSEVLLDIHEPMGVAKSPVWLHGMLGRPVREDRKVGGEGFVMPCLLSVPF